MKYNVGDRVRIKSLDWYKKTLRIPSKLSWINKQNGFFEGIRCGSRVFTDAMRKYCGKVMTIQEVGMTFYLMEEDKIRYEFTDEMIEGLVEEETKPKYEDEVNGEYYSTPKYLVRPSGYQFKDENGNVINAQKIVLEKLLVPKFKKGDRIKDKGNRVWYVVQVGNKHYDISHIPDGLGYFVPMEDQDDYELFPDRELPKTFEECVSVLEGENRMSLELMNTFRKLIDARNAYWKIAGENLGLGKPWEPGWDYESPLKYIISCHSGVIIKAEYYGRYNKPLSFPTAEMRDAFYENFKEEIEICKELL